MSKARDGVEDLKTIDANLAAKAPLASPSFTGTGTVNGKLAFFDGSQTRNGGVATEANAALINFGLNEGSGNRFGGTYNQASQGGMLNFDTRANQPLFQIYGRAAGVAEATGTALLNIDSSGAVTKPLQPAFQAYATGHANVPISTWHEMAFTEIFDNNADFDASNNKFVAPVTGKYQFNLSVRLDNFQESTVYFYLKIQTSNRQTYFIWSGNQMDSNMTYLGVSGGILTDMDANDEAKVQYFIHGGAAVADLNAESRFSGFLAC